MGRAVERYSRYVYAIVVRGFRLGDDEAEDVFQDVFLRVYERLETLRDDEALRPWIAQVARRICIDRLAERRRSALPAGELDEDPADPAGEGELAGIEEAMDVHEALAGLEPPCREMLDRFFARDEPYRVIADALGVPMGTVASRISRCLDKLRVALAEGRNPPPERVWGLSGMEEDVSGTHDYTEEQIAERLRRLPPAPAGWVRAACELPRARELMDGIVARAEADAEYRRAVLADLEAALRLGGVEPAAPLLEELRRQLAP